MKSKNPPATKVISIGGSSPEPLLKTPVKVAVVSIEELAEHNLLHITKFRVE